MSVVNQNSGSTTTSPAPTSEITVVSPIPLTASSVTITIADGDEPVQQEQQEQETATLWEGIIAFEGKPTSDGRLLINGEITHRELPVPLMAQFQTAEGHEEARIAGRVDEIWWQDSEDEEGVVEIWGRGPFDVGEDGMTAARLVEDKFLDRVSIDFAPTERLLLDPETHEPVDLEDLDMLDLLFGNDNFLRGLKGSIMGLTIVPFSAFEDSRIQTVTAGGTMRVIRPQESDDLPGGEFIPDAFRKEASERLQQALTAAAGPLKPPKEWFDNPGLKELTPLQITPEGRVFGHLADWDGCHTGFQDICIPPFRSRSDYAYFNVGEIQTSDGSLVPCGKIMFCREGNGHADINMNAAEASRYYDDATKVGAFVRAGSDRWGTWLAGVLRHDLTEEEIQHLRTHPPSGDWRPIKGMSDLVAAFAVGIPGFPIPRALVASAADGGYTIITAPLAYGPKKRRRRMAMLKARLDEALQRGEDETDDQDFAYTAEQRRRMAKNGQALPDGSFPIANCADAERAIHAQGRASDQKRAVAHIRKRVRALGCSGDIFDDYK